MSDLTDKMKIEAFHKALLKQHEEREKRLGTPEGRSVWDSLMLDEMGPTINFRKLCKREARRRGIHPSELSEKERRSAYIKAVLKHAKENP